MSTGPLRRAIGLAGLVALAPVLMQLAAGSMTPEDAALRGLAVALTVVLLGRVAQHVLLHQLRRMERRQGHVGAEDAHDRHRARGPDEEAASGHAARSARGREEPPS